MRLRKHIYQVLNEKVSKNEIDEALDNPNITIGIELEFKVNDLDTYIDDEVMDDYHSAYSDWEDYSSDIEEWENTERQLRDDLYKLNNEKEELEQEEQEDDISDRKMRVLELKLEKINDKISEIESELEDLMEPEPSDFYFDYCKKAGMMVRRLSGYYPEPVDPRESSQFSIESEEGWKRAVQGLKHLWDTLPVPHYQINAGSYNTWDIKYDASVEGGVEVVSPPISMREFLDITPKLFSWIGKNGYTDSDCGLHVHMGLKGVRDLSVDLDPIKMILLVDEDYIWKFFDERKVNIYTNSMKPKLEGRGIDVEEIKELINTDKLKKELPDSHYDAINFQSWEEGHVEFRHMGGTNYDRKWNEVKIITARNAHALSAGVDPQYKRQEYLTKLARMTDKFDRLKWTYVVDRLSVIFARKFESSMFEKYLKSEYIKVKNYVGNDSDLRKLKENISYSMNKDFVRFTNIYMRDMLEEFKRKLPKYEFGEKDNEVAEYINMF